MLMEHKRTVNYLPGRNQVAFHLPATTKAEEKQTLAQMAFHHTRSICRWFLYVIMLRIFSRSSAQNQLFHILNTLFFLHSQHSINTIGYLLRCNIQKIKGCTLKRKLFQAKNKHFSRQRREASSLAALGKERDFYTPASL